MSKIGQARVLDEDQFAALLAEIQKNRHPEKNTLLMEISFKLGLRVQEIALLRIKEVVDLGPQYPRGFKIKDLLVLPKGFTKGARAMERCQATPSRRSVRFTLEEFDQVVQRIVKDAKSGPVNPEEYYPEQTKKGGKTRELPIVDTNLKSAIGGYIEHRLEKNPSLKPNNPLIISQKGGAYSPNTLQDHMSMILKKWAGIERASSHSGRRTLATKLLHKQKEHLKTVQQILGHKDASTTVIYHELPESEIRNVLKKVGENFE
ncbi:MAG: tyrosine-type recombinase/integrase [Gammaproteobacteria bacterium]|nr:tyrosine-type recombinase/integrase [Gammaproteobacteria bacterium]